MSDRLKRPHRVAWHFCIAQRLMVILATLSTLLLETITFAKSIEAQVEIIRIQTQALKFIALMLGV